MKGQGTDTIFTVLTGGFWSTLAYLLGGIDNLSVCLAVFMLTDYCTGVISGFYNKNLSSEIAYKGLAKKSGMIAFIIVSNQLDIVTGNTEGFLRDAMMLFLIGTEGISIMENIGKLGYKIPSFIMDALRKLNGSDKEQNHKNKGA